MTQTGAGGVHAMRPPMRHLASGLVMFAGIIMVLVGLFHAIIGLTAIARGTYYMVTPNYVFTYNVTAWGWIHLILAVLVLLAGIAVLTNVSWAPPVAMILVGLSALGNFLFLPYQPAWSLLTIAVDIAIIWALAVRSRPEFAGMERTSAGGATAESRREGGKTGTEPPADQPGS
jgi:hypothetical protein